MSGALAYAVGLAVAANTCVYAGIAFYTGRLLPSFGGVGIPRLVVALLTLFFAANLCFGRLYTVVPPTVAGIISVAANVVIMVAATLLMEHRAPNVGMLVGAVLALSGALTVIGSR